MTESSWWGPHLAIGEVKIYSVDLASDREREAAALDWLDDGERDRLSRFVRGLPRRQFGLCRAALRALVCDALGCPNERLTFETGERGKPFAHIAGCPAPISVNVSHSDIYGLIAMAPVGKLGIDLEIPRQRPNLELLAETVLAPSERRQLELLDCQQKRDRFYELWTAKEALLKALGIGHALDPSELEIGAAVGAPGQARQFRWSKYPGDSWTVVNLGERDYAAALAWDRKPGRANRPGDSGRSGIDSRA